MKSLVLTLVVSIIYFSTSEAFGQLPVKPLASQAELLKSSNKKLAQNKKLVYDMWREFLEGGHMEVAEKYFAESYMQHNPNAATGRKAVVEFFSKFTKPLAIADTIKAKVVSIVAEGDLVVLSFVREMPDPNDPSKTYTTTWFDMFRIENGKIAEHWDSAEKMKFN
ncbi:nuclear transport factor 2 family protein [Arcicella rigui]|uniref:Ester cyclase n=1 Tax=Arcicella rigui TaxID=797020 RepID=A0ABU5QG19_9BACT|nr:nuclear transport factor 2 family protein [Arcicella rigui]MEA5141234.1 ester cyclase [Arcicella rigui]